MATVPSGGSPPSLTATPRPCPMATPPQSNQWHTTGTTTGASSTPPPPGAGARPMPPPDSGTRAARTSRTSRGGTTETAARGMDTDVGRTRRTASCTATTRLRTGTRRFGASCVHTTTAISVLFFLAHTTISAIPLDAGIHIHILTESEPISTGSELTPTLSLFIYFVQNPLLESNHHQSETGSQDRSI